MCALVSYKSVSSVIHLFFLSIIFSVVIQTRYAREYLPYMYTNRLVPCTAPRLQTLQYEIPHKHTTVHHVFQCCTYSTIDLPPSDHLSSIFLVKVLVSLTQCTVYLLYHCQQPRRRVCNPRYYMRNKSFALHFWKCLISRIYCDSVVQGFGL